MNERTTGQSLAGLVATGFLLVGILGFVPGVTAHFDRLDFAGRDSGAELLGVFDVSILHNVVHIAFGVVGLALARTLAGARAFLLGGGAIYLVLWIYGLIVDRGDRANFVPFDDADNWLHFAVGLTMVGLGFLLTRTRAREPAPVATP